MNSGKRRNRRLQIGHFVIVPLDEIIAVVVVTPIANELRKCFVVGKHHAAFAGSQQFRGIKRGYGHTAVLARAPPNGLGDIFDHGLPRGQGCWCAKQMHRNSHIGIGRHRACIERMICGDIAQAGPRTVQTDGGEKGPAGIGRDCHRLFILDAQRRQSHVEGSRTAAYGNGVAPPHHRGAFFLERRDFGPLGKVTRAQHTLGRLDLGIAYGRRAVRDRAPHCMSILNESGPQFISKSIIDRSDSNSPYN